MEGAYLEEREAQTRKAMVEFVPDATNSDQPDPILKDCELLSDRMGHSGGCALRFITPLTDSDLALLAGPPEGGTSLQLAHQDYRIVNDEIMHIQGCRNQIFIGAIAAISAWTITAVGTGLPNKLAFPAWLAMAASFPYIVISIALFATIEKANAINFRRGFLAALGGYLSGAVAPPKYLGWAHLRINMAECHSRSRAGHCPTRDQICWQDEVSKANRLTRKHKLISGGFKSFTAFVSLIYGLLYTAASVLMIIAGIYSFLGPARSWQTVLWVGLGLGALVPILTMSLISQLKQLRKGSKSPEAYYCRWVEALRHCKQVMPRE
jgi:hypothetical protein